MIIPGKQTRTGSLEDTAPSLCPSPKSACLSLAQGVSPAAVPVFVQRTVFLVVHSLLSKKFTAMEAKLALSSVVNKCLLSTRIELCKIRPRWWS